jgi:hypothetical protein
MPRTHPRWGIEFDWLGLDRQGQVAIFTTAGYGAVPEIVNLHLAEVDGAIEQVAHLPVVGSADRIDTPTADGDYSDWFAYSAIGFYAYDWHMWHGPYRRLCSPSVPIEVADLPPGLRQAAQYAIFELSFSNTTAIPMEYREPPNP